MKLLRTITLTLMAAMILSSSSTPKDKDDHTLVALWKEYYAAEAADKPKTQASVLEKIKAEAKAKHLAWDYYDAASRLAQVRISGNWKLRDAETAARDKDIADFGEPVALFFLKSNYYGQTDSEKKAFIKDNEAKLKAGRNPEFYTRDWRINGLLCGNVIPRYLANDYEYCLWSVGDADVLVKEFTKYPLSAFAEFKAIDRNGTDLKKSLGAFAAKWKGKAAGLMAEQELLELRYNELHDYDNGSIIGKSAEFLALRDACKSLNSQRAAFKGEEKKIADCLTRAGDILESLESKSVSAQVLDGKLTVTLVNLEAVSVNVFQDNKKVYEKYLTNPVRSYHVEDKLMIDLPDLPDGTYQVKCFYGDIEDTVDYQKYTISASVRRNASGYGVWATDFISGEPLKKVSAELLKDDKVVESTNLVLDGYTTLPESFMPKLADKRSSFSIRIRCNDGRQRASRPVHIYSYRSYPEDDDPQKFNAVLITDRGAYNPEETLHFKAVVYNGRYSLKIAGAGVKVSVELSDPSGKTVEVKQLTTNEFGSVAGDFTLKRSERNGRYGIRLKYKDRFIGANSVRVDDFVLPTFDLVFDKDGSFERPVDEIRTGGRIYAYSGHSLSGADIRYTVRHNGEQWASGKLALDSDDRFEITFKPDSTATGYDWYQVNVKVIDSTGETMEWNKGINIYPLRTPVVRTEYFFDEKNEDGNLELKAVAGSKPVWMLVEAHGNDNHLLWKRIEQFKPAGGPACTTMKYSMKDGDPEVMEISVLYFQDKNVYNHVSQIRKVDHRWDLPLEFTRFLDTTAPASEYTFEIKTLANAELAASIFDKSTERYQANNWSHIRAIPVPGPSISVSSMTGTDESSRRIMVRGFGGARMMSKASSNMVMMATADAAAPMAEEMAVEEEAIPFQLANDSGSDDIDVPVRENFANTIAWEPFLRSDADGRVQFKFTNADKLSTYYVQIFAHDKQMRNETLRREMVVTIPVKISLVEPQFLYEGDKYIARIALSSALSKDINGTLTVQLMEGTDSKSAKLISTATSQVSIAAKSSASQDFVLEAPGVENLGIKAVFRPESGTFGSDAVFVSMPVKKPVQTLTEAHSAVLLAGADKAALEAELRAMFENVDGRLPELQEISIRKMIQEALPSELEPGCDNAISLARALYAWSLCRELGIEPEFDREETVKKLLACRNSDGGFGWFAGMSSSSLVTAVVLRLLHGLEIVDEAAAVKYIDARQFEKNKNGWWYRGLSMEQYLHTRSLFPEVAFNEKTDADWRKAVRAYLVPSKARGLNGWIAAKARRVQTLDNFLSAEGGPELASKLGVKLGTKSKLRKSLEADVASLIEYAQPHKSGGVYYPNAVMPWRGLLETELDAHCALIGIMDKFGHSEISDGIRLWIMIQKETQDWKQNPGYIEAIGAVLSGPESVLQTKVLALKAEYTLPFDAIRASGNGMSISRSAVPEVMQIGDRVKLSFDITNEENRSFVKVTIPFGAGLTPVNQLSGYRWGYYRNVLSDRIECWYEVYPEEKTTVSEEFYVTRAGSFQAPVATIECEYAPHYRANDAWHGRMEISAK